MAIYSRSTRSAIRILTYMASESEPLLVRDLARASGVSVPMTAKLLQALAREGILESRKGPGGGFRLAMDPQGVTLRRIIEAIEGKEPLSECVGGFEVCSSCNPCPLHHEWEPVKGKLLAFFEATTLQTVLHAGRETFEIMERA